MTRTSQLEDFWSSFIHENPDLEEEFKISIEIFDKIAINKRIFNDTDILFKQIIESVLYKKKRKKRIIYYISSAAAIALLFLISTLYFIRKDNNSMMAISAEVIGKTLPEQEVKLLAGGKEIVLNQNVTVHLNDGQISYTDSADIEKTLEVNNVQTNKLIVPNGKRSFLILADGTKVWINSGTELEFPTNFPGKRAI